MAVATAATAVLPPRAVAVAMKTPVVTAMVGAQTTINNQIKAATTMAMEMATVTATAMSIKMKATATAEARQQNLGGGG